MTEITIAKITPMRLDVLPLLPSAKIQNFSVSLIFSVFMRVGFVMAKTTARMRQMKKDVVSCRLFQFNL